jgi:Vitamin K-dependent gamma-carboxylase
MWITALIPATDSDREPSRPLAIARILVGVAALLQIHGIGSQLARLAVSGTFRAPYRLSPPIGAAPAPVLIPVMLLLAAMAIVGWRTRMALAGLAAIFAFVLALDQQLYRNDLYLLVLECGMLCLANGGAALSLDASRRGGKDHVDRWPVALLKIQLSIIYASAALAKINPLFLRGEILQAALRFEEIPVQVAVVLSLATIAMEGFLAMAPWVRAMRRPAMLVGFLLHSSFVFLLAWGPGLIPFGLEMLALYVLFPGIRPGELLVRYDGLSPFHQVCMEWCRRADWLRACQWERHCGAEAMRLGVEVIHGPERLRGFEALREIAHVLPLTWFLAPVLSLPGAANLGRRAYESIASRERAGAGAA